ncbi:MAG TPA: hypothetical protein VFF57_10165 [Hanamia sp.]|nr:hypothetical protein [Hanamia sp.]
MQTEQIKAFNNNLNSLADKLLLELEKIYKDIPSNHYTKFAPVINPTLKTGLQAMMTAAAAWLN